MILNNKLQDKNTRTLKPIKIATKIILFIFNLKLIAFLAIIILNCIHIIKLIILDKLAPFKPQNLNLMLSSQQLKKAKRGYRLLQSL